MKSDLDKLYQVQLLEESKEPYHFESKNSAQHIERAYNSICGDRFDLFLNVENETITEFYFSGFGCAISKAATSIMIRELEGKSLTIAREIVSLFIHAIEHKSDIEIKSLKVFENTENFKGRLDCILLSWKSMETVLKKI